jgi:hypothetical protein
MTHGSVLRIAFHGVLLLVLGMLVGLPFALSITGDAGPEAQRAWRVAHTSLMGAGTLYVAIAAIAHHLVLSDRAAGFVTWALVLSAYAFAFTFAVGPFFDARGLEATGPAMNALVFGVFAVSLPALFIASIIVLWGLLAAVRQAR